MISPLKTDYRGLILFKERNLSWNTWLQKTHSGQLERSFLENIPDYTGPVKYSDIEGFVLPTREISPAISDFREGLRPAN
jgi:hypothetical protein